MTTSPAEVTLTSRGSAVVQRVLAGLSLAGVAVGMVLVGLSGGAWWAILLGELGLLVTAFLMLAIWFSAADSAKETTALVASGTRVLGEVTDKSLYDDSDEKYYDLTLWLPVPDGGFEVGHRCGRPECAELSAGARLPVLVDPHTRTWAVLH
ncbi:hypothetical protein ACFWNN_05535 [Lentzea sp. NPDC058450]|uniref:hypothetical protein n=1 Tax=Lentzea sp. NPDC058450 TaxID=3346505 RepID=UPI003666DDC8